MKLEFQVTAPKEGISLFFKKVRDGIAVDDSLRRVMKETLNAEIREQMDSEGRGQWAALHDRTLEDRSRRWGYYKRGAWRTSRIGAWTGENRRVALGEGGTRPLAGGIERRMRRKALIYFHRGTRNQDERPIFNAKVLKMTLKAALEAEIRRKLNVKVVPFSG